MLAESYSRRQNRKTPPHHESRKERFDRAYQEDYIQRFTKRECFGLREIIPTQRRGFFARLAA